MNEKGLASMAVQIYKSVQNDNIIIVPMHKALEIDDEPMMKPAQQDKNRKKSSHRDIFESATMQKNLFNINDEGEEDDNYNRQEKSQPASGALENQSNFFSVKVKRSRRNKKNDIVQQTSQLLVFENSSDEEDRFQIKKPEVSTQKKEEMERKNIFYQGSEDEDEDEGNGNGNGNGKGKDENNDEADQGDGSEDGNNSKKDDAMKYENESQSKKIPEVFSINPAKQFLSPFTIMEPNLFAKLKLKRTKQWLGDAIYSLYLENNMRLLISAKNVSPQAFLLSTNLTEYQENGQTYIGKIKTNFFGTELNAFGRGLNPENAEKDRSSPRQLLLTVITEGRQLLQDVKPRQFSVYILKPGVDYYRDLKGPIKYREEIPLNKLYLQHIENRSKIYFFTNRQAKWNAKQKVHSLNMKGRASIASIKNFILEDNQDEDRDIMLLGKVDKNVFNIDIHHPISPMIALCIAMSSFCCKAM